MEQLQSWLKTRVGHFAFYAEFLQYSLPPLQCWETLQQGFPSEQQDLQAGFGPKDFCFWWRTIDCRGIAFCKSVPYNFSQDCRWFKNPVPATKRNYSAPRPAVSDAIIRRIQTRHQFTSYLQMWWEKMSDPRNICVHIFQHSTWS